MKIRLKIEDEGVWQFRTYLTVGPKNPEFPYALGTCIKDIRSGILEGPNFLFFGGRTDRTFDLSGKEKTLAIYEDGSRLTERCPESLNAILWPVNDDPEVETSAVWWERYGKFRALAETALMIGDEHRIKIIEALSHEGLECETEIDFVKDAMNRWSRAFAILPEFLTEEAIGNVPAAIIESLEELGISGDPFDLFNVESDLPVLKLYAEAVIRSKPEKPKKSGLESKRDERALALGPSLSQAVWHGAFETLFAEPRARARVEGLNLIRGRHTMSHAVSSIDADAMALLTRGVDDFCNAEGLELFKLVVNEAHARCAEMGSCSASPHIEISLDELCRRVGANDPKSAARLWPALKAGQDLRFSWPGVIHPIGLWQTSRKRARKAGESDTVVIVPNAPLCPGFNQKFAGKDFGRCVAPIVPTPELTKSTKTRTAEAIFAARLSPYIAKHSLEIYNGSGAPLSVQTIEELTGDLGMQRRGAERVIERWREEMLEVWKEGKRCFMVFADNETYGPARRMICEQGEIRANSVLRGKANAEKKATARAKALKKAWPKKSP